MKANYNRKIKAREKNETGSCHCGLYIIEKD